MKNNSILITEEIRGEGVHKLRKETTVAENHELWNKPDQLAREIGNYNGLLVRNLTQVTEAVLSRAGKLKVIGRAGAGVDNIDVSAAAARGIPVVYAPEQNTRSVAEMVLGLVLSLARKIPGAHEDTASGNWRRHVFTGSEINGKTLGLAGVGRIGLHTGLLARSLGMRVLASPLRGIADTTGELLHDFEIVSFETLLAESDFISCHYRLTDETRHRFGDKEFNAMKRSACFINTSRGGIVNEGDLVSALERGAIAGAALDVRETEPPGRDRFCSLENVVLTPHIGAFTLEAQERVVEAVCMDMVAVLKGNSPRYPWLQG